MRKLRYKLSRLGKIAREDARVKLSAVPEDTTEQALVLFSPKPSATITAPNPKVVSTSLQPSATNASDNEIKTEMRLSCLEQAFQALRDDQPDVSKKLQEIVSKQEGSAAGDPEKLLELAAAEVQDNKGLPPKLESTIRYLLTFKSIVSAAADFDPHKIAPVVWKGVCLILESCLGSAESIKKATRDLNDVASYLSYWANVESLYLGTGVTDATSKFKPLETGLVKFYKAFLEMEAQLLDMASDGLLARVFKAEMTASIWQDLVKDVAGHHESCDSLFEMGKMKIKQHGKIKKWISQYQPEVAHRNIQERTRVDEKYQSCGQWLLHSDKFLRWAAQEETADHRVLWLRGTVGTGKTTLMTKVVQWHLDRASTFLNRRLAYFYCSRGGVQTPANSYKEVLFAILRQAAYDPVKGEISQPVINAYIAAGGDSADLKPLTFSDMSKLLQRVLESGVHLRVMIDALDECDEPKQLLKILRDASQTSPGKLELLVSSRQEVHVDEKFIGLARIDLQGHLSWDDMTTYITREVYDRDEDERLLKGKYPHLEREFVEILSRRAGGMFRWVELQLSFFLNRRNCPFLRPETVIGHLKLLDIGSPAGEKELNSAYDNIFQRNTSEGTQERLHAKLVYQLILYWKSPAWRLPVNLRFLAEAVAFNETGERDDSSDISYVQCLVQDFVVVIKKDKSETSDLEEIAFSHVSVKDYLLKEHAPEYDTPNSHADMFQLCLQHISHHATKDGYGSAYPGGFIGYAHENWGVYCSVLSRETRQRLGVSQTLLDFMSGGPRSAFHGFLNTVSATHIPYRQPQPNNHSPLFTICAYNLIEVLETLLGPDGKWPGDPNIKGYKDMTPLMVAADASEDDVFRLLLDTPDVDVNAVDIQGRSALFFAACHEQRVQLLIEKGAKVDLRSDINQTVLHYAVRSGNESSIRLLADAGVEINAIDEIYFTAFSFAIISRNTSLIRLLLELGADVNHKVLISNYHFQTGTALHFAVSHCLPEITQLLVEYGASVHATDGLDRTVLHLTHSGINPSFEQWLSVIECVTKSGLDVNSRAKYGVTPLHIAIKDRDYNKVRALLKCGANIDAEDDNSWSIMQAAEQVDKKMVQILLDHSLNLPEK